MLCKNCDAENPEGNAFCTNCGASLEGQAVSPGPPPADMPPPVPPAVPPPIPPSATVPSPPQPPSAEAAQLAPQKPKKRRGMWALIISLIALAIIAAVVLVLVFVVFAGDTGKAKDLMNKSDALMETVKTTGDKVGAAFNKLLTNLETSMTLTQYNEQVDAIKADTASAVKGLAEAKKGYQEILTLKGVDDYKRYANIVIKVINTDLEQIAAVKRFLDYSTGVLTDQATGKPLDTATFQATEEAAIARLNQLSNRAKTLKAEAVALKQQKDL